MTIWLIIFGGAAITYLTRLSFILILERWNAPEWFRCALRFVPAAVLSGLILPELVYRNGAVNLSLSNPELISGVIAVLVAWRSRNVVLTLAAGFAVYFGLALLGVR